MSLLRFLSRASRNLFQKERVEQDLDAELEAWVELTTDQKVKAGMNPAEARRAALVESGGVEQVKEKVRQERAGALLESVLRDVQFGARLLVKNPGFTATAVVMLALGIGANTAVFSVVNALVLRGLPWSDPGRIVALYEARTRETNMRNPVSTPDFLDWRAQSTSFESMAAVINTSVTWQNESGAERVMAGAVSPEFFDVLGVKLAMGAGFRKEQDIQGNYAAVVLTHGFWQRRFGGDSAVLGRSITINGVPREVVGVLPENFDYPVQDVEFFAPLWWRSKENLDRASHDLNVAARLKPGVSIRTAQAEMDAIASRLERQYPDVSRGHGVNIVPMRDVLLGPVASPLLALQAAVVFVLLIACGNLANLLLARTMARDRELAVRLAIGAGRGRLFRQLVCESMLLALLGGAAGVAVAYAAVPFLRSLVPDDLPLIGIRNVQVDGTVLGVCLLLSVVCGLVFGLAPAWRGVAGDISGSMKDGAGAGGGPRRERLRMSLIGAQVALSVILLTGTVMFLRSFAALRSVDPGFRSAGVLTMQMGLPGSRYKEPERVIQFTSDWMDSIRRQPGVETVGLTSHLPVSGQDSRRGLVIEGVDPPDPNQPRRAHPRFISPGYFQAMGLRTVQGRPFLETDRMGSKPVMMVNETAARKYFPNGNAVGHYGRPGGDATPWREVVGVVADVRHWGLDAEPRPEQYYCHLQEPTWTVNLVIRGGDSALLASAARRELQSRDAGIPLARVQTMDTVIKRSIGSQRSMLILLGIFGGIALLLTSAGIWGTMAYLLQQRRREIGIRLALGATDGVLVRYSVGRAMRSVGVGIAVGVAVSVLMVRLTSVSFFGVSPADPVTYAVVPVVLGVVAWLANYYPARRMVRTTPNAVLRAD